MNENGVVRSRLFFLFLVFRFLEFGPVSVTAEILATAKLHALISVGWTWLVADRAGPRRVRVYNFFIIIVGI